VRGPLPFESGTFIAKLWPLEGRGDNGRSSRGPIKPSVELRRSVVSVTEGILKKEKFELSIRGLSIPALKGEAFRPLNLFLCKDLVIIINTICTFKLLSFPETILIRLNLTSQIVNRHSSLKAYTLPLHSLLSLR